MAGEFRIGEVAQRSGVSVDTIRYYERRKLLPAAPRTASGYRLFTSETLERVAFIRQAQELGFSLEEIGILLSNRGLNEWRRVRDLLRVKLVDLDDRLKRMREFRSRLAYYLAECEEELREHPDSAGCPVVIEIAHTQKS